MKIVIAGSFDEYKRYLYENRLSMLDARFVSSLDQLRGLRDVEVVRYGNYWLNPCNDASEYLNGISIKNNY